MKSYDNHKVVFIERLNVWPLDNPLRGCIMLLPTPRWKTEKQNMPMSSVFHWNFALHQDHKLCSGDSKMETIEEAGYVSRDFKAEDIFELR